MERSATYKDEYTRDAGADESPSLPSHIPCDANGAETPPLCYARTLITSSDRWGQTAGVGFPACLVAREAGWKASDHRIHQARSRTRGASPPRSVTTRSATHRSGVLPLRLSQTVFMPRRCGASISKRYESPMWTV